MTDRNRNAIIAVVLVAFSILPLWSGRYLPSVDFSQHVFAGHALARLISGDADYGAIYAERHDASAFTFHYFLAGITLISGDVEFATKLHLSIVVTMLVAALSMLCASFGRSRWLAFLAPCLVYGSDLFSWGLFPYLACIPAVLAGTACLVRVLEDGRRFAVVGLSVATVFIGLGHVIAYIPFFVIVAALLATARSPFLGRALLGISPVTIFIAGGLLRTMSFGYSSMEHLPGGFPVFLYDDPHHASFWSALFGTFKSPRADLTPGALLLAAVVCVAARAPHHASGALIGKRSRFQPLLISILLVALYYVIPYGVLGLLYLISIRIPFVAALFMVASLPFYESGSSSRGARVVRVAIAAVVISSSFATSALVGDFNLEAAPIEPIIASIRADGNPCPRIYNMDLIQSSRVATHAQYLHFGEYVAARTHGVPSASIVPASGVYPLAYRDDVQPSAHETRPPQPKNEWEPWLIDYDSMLVVYDYILMRDTGMIAAGFAEEYRDHVELVVSSDSWFLFRILGLEIRDL